MKALPRPRVRALGIRNTRPVRGAGRQFAAQRASTLNEQRLINGFMADAHGRVVREVHRQATGDLLRAPGVCPSPVLPWSVPTAFPGPRPGREQEPRSEPQRRQPAPLTRPHRFLTPRCAPQLRLLWAASSALGVPLRCRRTIREAAASEGERRVAPQLSGDCRCHSPEPASDLLHGVALNAKERDLLPAPQTRDTDHRAASPIAQTSMAACPLPS